MAFIQGMRNRLPGEVNLPDHAWRERHRWISHVTLGMSVVVLAYGFITHHEATHVLTSAIFVAGVALAVRRINSRGIASAATTVALLSGASAMVHFSGGLVEMHFLFFISLGIVTLYQSWIPFGVAVLVTVAHHAGMGLTEPLAVFNHDAAVNEPIKWALIHAGFVLVAGMVNIAGWRLLERPLTTDELTGLTARVLLFERLERSLALAKRTHSTSAVLFADLVRFKHINDSLGHTTGDAVLAGVATRVRAAVRGQDTVARFGGDEFVVVADNVDRDGAEDIARRITESLREPLNISGREIVTSLSIGIVVADGHSTTELMIQSADTAMYEAKRAGEPWRVFEPHMSSAAVRRSDIEQSLRMAIVDNRFTIAYQPIVNLRSRRVTGAEALIRWTLPNGEVVSPDEFVPLAEEIGEIGAIDRMMVRRALTEVARWRSEGIVDDDFTLHVNASPSSLRRPAYRAELTDALRATDTHPSKLVVEVTETVVMTQRDAITNELDALRRAGVRVAVDDFGTGYSSLARLKDLPIDTIKIDKSFVDDVPGGLNAAVTAGIIDVARRLGLTVIIEGVESDEQIEALIGMGAELAQGFELARPAAGVDIPGVLAGFSARVPA